MIIMKKYLYIITLFLGVVFLNSCSQHEGTTLEGIAPYFKTAKVNVEVSDENNGVFTVEVWRLNPTGDAEVNLALTLPSGVSSDMFDLPSPKAIFKDGEYSTSVQLKFDLAKLVVPTVYSLELAITDKPIANSSKPLVISVGKKWVFDKSLGKGTFKSGAFETTKEIEVLGINGSVGVYQIKDAYKEGFPIQFALLDGGKDIIFQDQKIGVSHPTYGDYTVSLYDFKVEGKKVQLDLELTVSAGSFGVFVEEITLP